MNLVFAESLLGLSLNLSDIYLYADAFKVGNNMLLGLCFCRCPSHLLIYNEQSRELGKRLGSSSFFKCQVW